MNRKPVQGLWWEEGLRRPQFCRKRRRLGPTLTGRLRASRPNQVWAIDFQFDEIADGRRRKLADIVGRVQPRNPGRARRPDLHRRPTGRGHRGPSGHAGCPEQLRTDDGPR